MSNDQEININYSTVSDYMEGVKAYGRDTHKEWHVYKNDFFPYMTD